MASPGFYPSRSASLVITVFGAITNSILAFQVLTAWRSLRWEPESEWEASSDSWQVDGVKVIWGLLSAYFASSAAVCIVGLMGILRSKPSFIRFYRDYSIADFTFCTFVTGITTYAIFHSSARAAICEELSHHPELVTELGGMGLNLENCERWLERGVLASVAFMVVIIVIRLHFLLAVSNYHTKLLRQQYSNPSHTRSHSRFRHPESSPLQRIYLLPTTQPTPLDNDVELVYAPVALSSLPENVRSAATEAWVSRGNQATDGVRRSRAMSDASSTSSCAHYSSDQQEQQHRQQKHHRRHSHGHSCGHHRQSPRSSSASRTGTIRLPILPDEGLLPPSYDTKV